MFDGLFQPMHLIVILFIALLVFGPKKLPELGKSLGKGLAEFRRASAELRGSLEREMENIEHEVKVQEQAKQQAAPVPTATIEAGTSQAAQPPSHLVPETQPELHAGLHPDEHVAPHLTPETNHDQHEFHP